MREIDFKAYVYPENNKNDGRLRACGCRFVRGELFHTWIRIGGLSFPPVIDAPFSSEGPKTGDKLTEASMNDGLSYLLNAEFNRWAVVALRGLMFHQLEVIGGNFPLVHGTLRGRM
jgi:hypothetical protein